MKILLFTVIFFAIILVIQGCVTATIVGTVAFGIKTTTDPRTIGVQVDDNTLKLRVINALHKDKQLKEKTRINLIVYQNKIILIGQVPNKNLLLRVKNIVMSIEGVTEVFNEIRQDKPVKLDTILYDIWITTKIYLQLVTNNQIKHHNVQITTENKEVFIFGILSEYESKIITQTASHTKGVKRVTTVFSY